MIRESNTDEDILLVDESGKIGEIILRCKVVCEYELKKDDNYIVALGSNDERMRLYQKLESNRCGNCISVISVNSHIGMEAKIGRGTFIASCAYIGPQAVIGNNSIINTGSIVEHEVQIGNHTHIAPNVTICGRSCIGDNVFCGAGCIVIDNIHVCNHVTIGAGAVVKEDIVEAGTYVGVPARKIM